MADLAVPARRKDSMKVEKETRVCIACVCRGCVSGTWASLPCGMLGAGELF